jgi:hypothetical protein
MRPGSGRAPPRRGNAPDLADTGRRGETGQRANSKSIASADSVRRYRLAARCLDLSIVFVGDRPPCAELFDASGCRVETWGQS